ncbi:hypothetical protein BC940DRAFT_241722 [Gongronella butleri]|nr:hypothetical protein BC940DRAFT_241722 [Gongronella butleri]
MIFIGEIVCIVGIQIIKKGTTWFDQTSLDVHAPTEHRQSKCASLWFIVPSACDLISTTLLNLGLIYSTPSVYQMVRSSIVGFSAVFSFIFLARRFLAQEWVSALFILLGIGLVAFHPVLDVHMNDDGACPWFGPSLLLISQVFVALQFILEEFLMDRFQLDPVRAMGIEGVFGALLLGVALILSAILPGVPAVLDVKQGFDQLFDSNDLVQSSVVLAAMVAIFNFFGLAVSTSIGIPGRSVLDALRTTLIWIVAVHYGYDAFSWVQLIGFLVLVFGIFVFNGVFSSVYKSLRERFGSRQVDSERAPLLS